MFRVLFTRYWDQAGDDGGSGGDGNGDGGDGGSQGGDTGGDTGGRGLVDPGTGDSGSDSGGANTGGEPQSQGSPFAFKGIGDAGEDGRPANVPAKYWQPGAEGAQGTVDVGAILTENEFLSKQRGKGAPKDGYEIDVERVMGEATDWKVTADDPLVAGVMEWAKARNIDQEGFDDLLKTYGTLEMARVAQQDADSEAESKRQLEMIGDNAEGRIRAVVQHMDNELERQNVGEQERNRFTNAMFNMIETKDDFDVVSFLLSNLRVNPLPNTGHIGAASGITEADIEAAHNKRYEDGDHKGELMYDYDPEYRKKVDAMYSAFYGDAPETTQVG